jgi:UDP-N-acetyl-D-mannosaminuronic acid dehydrogenase
LVAARRVNDGMPAHCAEMVADLFSARGIEPDGTLVAVLGYAYREESDDTRNSPSEALVTLLERMGCRISIHDPFVEQYAGDLFDAARGADCVVVMVSHRAYRELDLGRLANVMRTPLLVDTRAVFERESAATARFEYRRLGDGRIVAPV